MKYLLRLPRWLAGAFLLFSVPAFAQPAVAFDCSTIQYFRQQYSEARLRTMARQHGYSEEDIAKAEACMPKPDIEVTKRSPTLGPVHTLKAPKAKAAPVVVPTPVVATAPVATPAPAVVMEAPQPAPEPTKTSWLWDVLTDLGFILIIGSALGLLVTWGTKLVTAYRAARAVATIAKV